MSLIEYMATAGALAFVLWGLRWHETGKWRWYVAALAAGAIGLLVKSTTGVIYLVPLAVLVLGVWWRGKLPVARRSVYALAIVALAAGVWMSIWAYQSSAERPLPPVRVPCPPAG